MTAINVSIKNNTTEINKSNLLYPTITDNFTNVYLAPNFSESVNIFVLDLQGKVISNKAIQQLQNESIVKIDFTDYAKGMYVVRIVGNKGNSESFKVVKK